ncbi:hypothetical protein [Aeoliella sp.]|uniref:hypothetical protein n=1 Tax=Aeoliella sp. TaxID=2795800 RepID=UPI003CCBA580
MPAKPRVQIDLVGDETRFEWYKPSRWSGFYLGVLLSALSALIVFAIHWLLTDFQWFVLLTIPLLALVWIFLAYSLAIVLFGRESLAISPDSLEVKYYSLGFCDARRIPLGEVLRVKPGSIWARHNNRLLTRYGIIAITTFGNPAQFAVGIDDEEAEWLAEVIYSCIRSRTPRRPIHQMCERLRKLNDFDPWPDGDLEGSGGIEFTTAQERYPKPSDSTWKVLVTVDAIELSNRRRWSFSDIVGLLLLNICWMGVVGAWFQLAQSSVFLSLLLIPTVVLGICFVASLLSELTAPAWAERYTIRIDSVEHRWSCPLFAKTSLVEFDALGLLKIRDYNHRSEGFNLRWLGMRHITSGNCKVVLVDSMRKRIGSIDSLTAGEALWIADTIARELPGAVQQGR